MLAEADRPAAYEPYSCEIESLTKVEQSRSPAPAMESIKRALRSMFKRGKKSKQEEQKHPPAQAQQPKPTTASPAKLPASPPKAAEGRQAQGVEQNTAGRLPTTHPLFTGRHDQPQSAIPLDRAAQTAMPPVAGGADGVGMGRPEERLQPTPTPATTAPIEPVSAVQRDDPPAPPPKTDGAGDAMAATPREVAAPAPVAAPVAAPAVTERQPVHMPPTSESTHEPPREATKDIAPPNSIVSKHAIPAGLPNAAATEDNIPVTAEQPAAFKAAKVAPGMSATSGPLEDFPEVSEYTE
ncbi:hypothetical protein LTR75_002661 [Friedmanniomyces endolithicus]|nr:hypothetical protein LTR75_002661 [Friedmanniomyces endolithicus]